MTLYKLRRRLEHLHDEQGMKWRKIAEMEEFNGVSFGTLNAIYRGREPKEPTLRRKLGLPVVEFIAQVRNNKTGKFSSLAIKDSVFFGGIRLPFS